MISFTAGIGGGANDSSDFAEWINRHGMLVPAGRGGGIDQRPGGSAGPASANVGRAAFEFVSGMSSKRRAFSTLSGVKCSNGTRSTLRRMN
jgi:hypothetical protein